MMYQQVGKIGNIDEVIINIIDYYYDTSTIHGNLNISSIYCTRYFHHSTVQYNTTQYKTTQYNTGTKHSLTRKQSSQQQQKQQQQKS